MQEIQLRSRVFAGLVRPARVVALVVVVAVGCRRSYPLGKLSVRVSDAKDAPVAGVAADLVRITPTGRVYWRASRTTANGVAVFGEKNGGVIEGDYMIHLVLAPWQKFAEGQTNNRIIKVKKGDDTVIRFTVVPKQPLRQLPRLTP
jgi:hypothetical protein